MTSSMSKDVFMSFNLKKYAESLLFDHTRIQPFARGGWPAHTFFCTRPHWLIFAGQVIDSSTSFGSDRKLAYGRRTLATFGSRSSIKPAAVDDLAPDETEAAGMSKPGPST